MNPADDLRLMKEAEAEARLGLQEGGIPIGSILVRGGQVVGRGHNQRVQKGSAILHGEMDCLMNAGRQKSYRDTVLYSTLCPCFMCAGTIVQFKIPRVVVGEAVNFPGAPDFLRSQGVAVVILNQPGLIRMMADFIRAQPELWNEDIAE
ncbi:MAG: nucleoside deaminase [Verrucomicrobia bacterium]|nr:nucleoside deaminase [Verrucomicrobiota bacterium]